jgi:hypothetical protein
MKASPLKRDQRESDFEFRLKYMERNTGKGIPEVNTGASWKDDLGQSPSPTEQISVTKGMAE